ncbi:MAG: T9SS type A sorting domain-containing protein [Aureispira sp.]|nr:T9SS type A sorting domain-containing protein [Aureispira sp.]
MAISTIDLSNATNLISLLCYSNQLTTLDISNCTNLMSSDCRDNQLTALDLSSSANLNSFNCENNQLAHLDLRWITSLALLSCSRNTPFLQICVADLQAANNSTLWTKDPSASYTQGCPSKAVEGFIAWDTNYNCVVNSTEQHLNGTIIQFEKDSTSIYVSADTNGLYTAYLDTGNYTISAIPPSPYFVSCPSSQQLTVDTNYTIQQADFALQDIIQCPHLEVEITTPRLRRCFNSLYYVNYCNTGTLAATNAYVEVELDNYLTYNSSTLSLQSQVGNKYRFNVGNLAVGQCGSFVINVTVNCTNALGQIHCTEAHIYPDSTCTPYIPSLQIEDSCLVDTILFTVFNVGDALPQTVPYWILEDTTIVDTGSIWLNAGQLITILYPTSGNASTYQLLIDPNFSEYFQVSQQVICNPATNNSIPTFLPSNSSPFIATDCQATVGSYDPNDKQASPIGLGTDHYLLPNTNIDYKIRFQNTGTDTAIFINIVDTLSSKLDVSSLEMGVSSHPFTWEFIPNTSNLNILRIIFDPIYLPDSNVNEAASHGFVQFSIKQKPNLANYTRIENSAAIYFDYNEPVITNTAFHTICDNCIPMNITGGGVITSTKEAVENIIEVKVYPNPFKEQTTLEIEGGNYEGLELSIYDITGKEVMQYQTTENSILIQRNQLPQGIYIYQLKGNQQLIHTGKLIIQ